MTLQGCEFRPLRLLGADTGALDLCSVNARQVAYNAVEGWGKGAAVSKAVFKSPDTGAMPYWTISEQVQGLCTEVTASVDMTVDVAPCTPLQAFARQKPQTPKTSESSRSLPSLSLRIGFSEGADVLNQTSQVALITSMPKSQHFSLQQSPARATQFANSTPSKVLDRIHQEVQKGGAELHKENLLSLSLPKQEKWPQVLQRLDPALSLGQHMGQALPSRVLSCRGVSKVSATDLLTSQLPHVLQSSQSTDGVHNGSSFLLGSSHLKLLQQAKPKTMVSGVSLFSGYSDSLINSEATDSKKFSSEPKKSLTPSSIFGKGSESKWVSQEASLDMKSVPAFMDGRNLLEAEVSRQWTPNGVCTTSFLPVKQDSNQALVECAKYMQWLPGAPDFLSQGQQITSSTCALRVDSCDSGNPEKRLKSLSSTSGSASGSSQEQGRPNGLLKNREARNPTRKKRPAVEQPKSTCCSVEVASASASASASAQWYGQPTQNSQIHINCLPEYVSIPKLCTKGTECNNLICLSQGESTEKHGENVRTLQEEHIPSQLSPIYTKEQNNSSRLLSSMLVSTSNRSFTSPDSACHFEKVFSNAMEEVNAQSVGLKLSTTPAHAQMPKALPTFAAGEPCLPFPLELSQKPPDAVAGKTPINMGSSSDADWGKYLALSATPVGQKAEADAKTILPFQQRFKKLQAFLKQCDESDQTDCLQALRALSASARSGHAVELETRAIRLSLEEGKEIDRMKLLNVLGHVPDKNLYDAGATPHGPRLPAPGAASKVKQGS